MPEKLKLLLCHWCGFQFTDGLHEECPKCHRQTTGIASFLHQILNLLEKQMAGIDNLNANIQKLSADVDAALANQGPSDSAVQAAADAVAAVDAKLGPLLPPPAPGSAAKSS